MAQNIAPKSPEAIQCPTCGASVPVSTDNLFKSPLLTCPQGHAIQVRAEKARAEIEQTFAKHGFRFKWNV